MRRSGKKTRTTKDRGDSITRIDSNAAPAAAAKQKVSDAEAARNDSPAEQGGQG
jgi:hypothetical protein